MANGPGEPQARYMRVNGQAWLLASVIFVCRLGAMVKLFMAVYLKLTLGLSIEIIGLLLSSYGAGLMAGSYLIGVFSDYWPSKTLTLCLMVFAAITLAALPWLRDIAILAITLILSGFLDGGIRTLHQRLILDFCAPAARNHAQALSRVGINLGMACAGLLGGLISQWDMHALFYLSAGLLFAAATGFALGSRQWSPVMATSATDRRCSAGPSPYKNYRFLAFLLGCTLLGLAYEPIYSTLGNYLIEYYKLSPAAIGWQFALNGFLVVTLQIPISRWSNPWGVRSQLVAGCLLLGLGLLPLAYGSTLTHVSFCTVLWTFGELLFMPAMAVYIMQLAEGRRSGHFLGLHAMFWSAGTLLSPLIASQIYSRLGGGNLWIACCAMALGAMVLIMLTVKHPEDGT